MRRCASAALALAWLAAVALAPSAARADEPAAAAPATAAPPGAAAPVPPEARRLTERGLERFAGGRYDEAVSDFEASYALSPAPGLLYNLAQAHRLRGDCAAALSFYRRFLEADPSGRLRERTQARIAETEKCAAAAKPPAPPPAPRAGVEAPPAPGASPPPALAPPRAPAPAAGAPLLTVASPPSGADAVAAPHRSWRRGAGVGLGVAAVAFGVTSAVLGVEVSRAADDTSRTVHEAGMWDPSSADRESSALHDQKLAFAAGGAALVAAAVSAWLLLHGERKPAP